MPANASGIKPSDAAPLVRHLYLHVPFCHRVCPYCSFHKHTFGGIPVGDFVRAILREIDLQTRAFDIRPRTFYIGGGTPTALSEAHLQTLLEGLSQRFNLGDLREFTVEANPRTVTSSKARLLRDQGVNRISLGIQAWDAATLEALGRDHSPHEAEETYGVLREAGFASVNLDLMFSIPGQAIETWDRTVSRTLDLEPDHISAYNLNYEEDTAFFERLMRGEYREDPERDAAFFDLTMDRLGGAGFRHYEISNYARPGHESLHNESYWLGADYLGFGPGAFSTIDDRRWKNASDTRSYLQSLLADAATIPVTEEEHLTPEQRRIERFGLELRTARGLPAGLIRADADALLQSLVLDGLIKIEDGFVRLQRQGKMLVDSIALALLG